MHIDFTHTHTHTEGVYTLFYNLPIHILLKKKTTNQPNKKPTPKTHPAPEQEFFSLKIENAFVLFFKLTVEF